MEKTVTVSSRPPDGGPGPSRDAKKGRLRKKFALGILAIVLTVGMGVAAIYYRDSLMSTASGYSLLGMLLISFLAGSVLSITFIPIPYWFLVFTLPSALEPHWGILAPVLVGVTSAFGATIGHVPSFMIGYGGKAISDRIARKTGPRLTKWYNRSIVWAKKHGALTTFLMSAILNPLHLPMTVAFGTLRYSPPKFFLFSFLGNIVKSMVLAFAGYYGLVSILRLLGRG